MPRSHNNSPRPMTSSCFTSSCCSVTITKCIWNGSAPRALLTRRFGQNLGFREPRRRVIAGCNRRPCRYIACEIFRFGGMAEWLKAHAWKACIRETVSWVRIPLPPPAASFAALRSPSLQFIISLNQGYNLRIFRLYTFAVLRHTPADSRGLICIFLPFERKGVPWHGKSSA